MSDALVVASISAAATVGVVLINGIIAVLLAILSNKTSGLVKVTNDTHTLVNSEMGRQKQLTAIALRRLAITTNNPKDVEAATLAESIYEYHMRRQAIVDNAKEKAS
jgi:hypothetical protein